MALELGDVNLSFGRLIDVWGAGDLLTVLDVTNPGTFESPVRPSWMIFDFRVGTRLAWSVAVMVSNSSCSMSTTWDTDLRLCRTTSSVRCSDDPGWTLDGKTLTYQNRPRFGLDDQSF